MVQDNYGYPILHDETGVRSEHLETAKNFYDKVRQTGAAARGLAGTTDDM